MAITFKTLRWKNFLSTGNAFTEIPFGDAPTTLVVGENGSGKSTLLDALCFALFNRPFRNINKPQLINAINKRDCLVEVEFTIGRKEYKIIRGMRPNVFEIYCDGNLLNQDAASRDYQKFLEESILRLNYRSFTQIVILGSASFKPFMQLHLGARREIIEDLLDIQIFTVMNQVLKERHQEMKDRLSGAENNLKLAIHKAKLQEEYIKTLQNDRSTRIEELHRKIGEAKAHIEDTEAKIQNLQAQREAIMATYPDQEVVNEQKWKYTSLQKSKERDLKNLKKELAFFQETDECPTCQQPIDGAFRNKMVSTKQDAIQAAMDSLAKLHAEEEAVIRRLEEIDDCLAQVNTLGNQINEENSKIIADQRLIQSFTLEAHELESKGGNVTVEQKKLKELAKDVLAESKRRSELNEEKYYLDIAGALLKDSGIKTKIIRKYLPVINKLVNKYLAAMDFFVQFTLDEQFNESIKSRFRDEFSYESFSEGEKQRIDLALVFTWRSIAKMKNSASTNLLIFDEVFDSSLDANGADYLMSLLNALGEDTHVWVISHKGDQLADKFRNIIRFKKSKNFSVMEISQ